MSIDHILKHLKNKKNFVFLDTILSDKDNNLSYIFTDPLEIISCRKTAQIKPCLEKLQKALNRGYYVGGFLSYESGYAFEETLPKKTEYIFPLIWMGVFKKPAIFPKPFLPKTQKSASYNITQLRLNTTREQYLKDIQKIRKLIAQGDTYQVNHTIKYKFNFQGSLFSLYSDLRNNQAVSYGALIKTNDFSILSFSPELFFKQNNQTISVKPMKGTFARGLTPELDKFNKNYLKNDPKNRAENIMIVDLLRNDLGKISTPGSVKTTSLFDVEKYRTLFQMTSTVESKLKNNIFLPDLFKSLFPSGSVTGAPKIRTMQIINNLEKEERKIYTGAIGFISPHKKACFNVAIRTILLEKNKGEMGVGSGITYSSDPQAEYAECKLKANFLTPPEFKLIETMRWSSEKGIPLLHLHLERLKRSAGFFYFSYNQTYIKKIIHKSISALSKQYAYKIRLLLSENGIITIEACPLSKQAKGPPAEIILSAKKICSNNKFFYHKTTLRKLYNQQYRHYKKQGFFDIIFRNEKNEITEGAISNIFIKKGRKFYTPAVSCGLLPGVFRKHFITQHKGKVIETILTLEDLKKADAIYCTNAVRGIVKVSLRSQVSCPKIKTKQK
ncbi:MAG: aminodeoxychorismate synthase component I [Candidatus Omnitrophota bacterium]